VRRVRSRNLVNEVVAHWGAVAPKKRVIVVNDFGAGGETRSYVNTKVNTILNIRTGWYKSG